MVKSMYRWPQDYSVNAYMYIIAQVATLVEFSDSDIIHANLFCIILFKIDTNNVQSRVVTFYEIQNRHTCLFVELHLSKTFKDLILVKRVIWSSFVQNYRIDPFQKWKLPPKHKFFPLIFWPFKNNSFMIFKIEFFH